jgi:hypothetical protein
MRQQANNAGRFLLISSMALEADSRRAGKEMSLQLRNQTVHER